ncbi:hypothetical protein [Flavobacterium sp.]
MENAGVNEIIIKKDLNQVAVTIELVEGKIFYENNCVQYHNLY